MKINEKVNFSLSISTIVWRLGSSSVILSRTFHRKSGEIGGLETTLDLKNELDKLLLAAERLKRRSPVQEIEDHRCLQIAVEEFVAENK